MTRRRVWLRRALLAGFVVLACEQTWRHGHDYVFPERLVEVVPGKLYRGAWQKDWPMRRIVREHHIKTIVALAHPPGSALPVGEKALADELHVRWLHIPIVEESTTDGQRRTVADALDRAADALADAANQPVYFHCHHGINRASMAQMAYRMKHCGWTLDQATREIQDLTGLVEVEKGVDYRYMAQFYNERVLPRRHAQARAETEAAVR